MEPGRFFAGHLRALAEARAFGADVRGKEGRSAAGTVTVCFGLKMREAVIRQGMAHAVSMTQSRANAGRQLYFSILVTTCADA